MPLSKKLLNKKEKVKKIVLSSYLSIMRLMNGNLKFLISHHGVMTLKKSKMMMRKLKRWIIKTRKRLLVLAFIKAKLRVGLKHKILVLGYRHLKTKLYTISLKKAQKDSMAASLT